MEAYRAYPRGGEGVWWSLFFMIVRTQMVDWYIVDFQGAIMNMSSIVSRNPRKSP